MAALQPRRRLSDAEARQLVDAGRTRRTRALHAQQTYYDLTQYEGRVPWLDVSSQLPRLERAPAINYPILASAVESYVQFAMGGDRFPHILSGTQEDDTVVDDEYALSDSDSKTIDGFNRKLIEHASLVATFRQAYRSSLTQGSVALVGCYRAGLPALDTIPACHCTPIFGPDQRTVVSLEIRYRFVDYFRDSMLTQGQDWPIVREYRRVIDQKYDTVYAVKDIWEAQDIEPAQAVDTRIAHGFSFCPVIWYARQRPSYVLGSYDGIALGSGKLAEIDAINHVLSTRHTGALYAGDPMLVGTGVDPDEDLGTTGGRHARPPIPDLDPQASNAGGWARALRAGDGDRGTIRKGPNEFWRTANDAAKIEYLTIPGDALKAISDHTDDLIARIREALRYVWIDPKDLTGSADVSGKTLAFIFSSQTGAVDDDRRDLEHGLIRPALGLLYQMLLARSEGVYVPGLAKALPILARFLVPLNDGTTAFFAPQLSLSWGDYFPPSDTDEQTRVQTATAAKTAGLITTQTAVEHVQSVFEITDPTQYVEALKDEKQEAQDSMAASLERLQAVGGGNSPVSDQDMPRPGLKPAKAKAKKPGKPPQAA